MITLRPLLGQGVSKQTFLELISLGFSPVACMRGGKDKRHPWVTYKELRERQATEAEIDEWLANPKHGATCDVSLITMHNDVLCADIDEPSVIPAIIASLGYTPMIRGREGSDRCAAFYRAPGLVIPSGYSVMPGLELKWSGMPVHVPPSLHHTGVPYYWRAGPVHVSALPVITLAHIEALRAALGATAPMPRERRPVTASLELPPVTGGGRDLAYMRAALRDEAEQLAGVGKGRNTALYEAVCRLGHGVYRGAEPEQGKPLSVDALTEALTWAMDQNNYIGEKGLNPVERTIASGLARSADDESRTPSQRMMEELASYAAPPVPQGGSLTPFNPFAQTSTAPAPVGFPFANITPQSPEAKARSSASAYELLGPIAYYLWTVAETTSSPLEYSIGSHLVCAAAAIGASTRVYPTSAWCEPIILRMALVGAPSSRKSPAMAAFEKALRPIQEAEQRCWEAMAAQRAAEAAKAEGKPTKAVVSNGPRLFAKYDEVVGKDGELLLPHKPYLIMKDTTPEKLAAQMQCRKRGLFLCTDELAGFVGGAGQYKKGNDTAERAFHCESFHGRPYSVHRMTRESLDISCCALSVLGPIVPERCRQLLMSASDGFVERFLFVYPEHRLFTRFPGIKRDDAYLAWIYWRLAEHCEELHLTFDDEARGEFEAYYAAVDRRASKERGIVNGAIGKLPGIVARLAGVLWLVDWAASGLEGRPCTVIDAACVRRAMRLGDWFELHLRHVVGETGLAADESGASQLMAYLKEKGIREFNAREVRRTCGIRELKNTRDFEETLKALIDAGHIKPKGRDNQNDNRSKNYIVLT